MDSPLTLELEIGLPEDAERHHRHSMIGMGEPPRQRVEIAPCLDPTSKLCPR
jgi:hypothetical protein